MMDLLTLLTKELVSLGEYFGLFELDVEYHDEYSDDDDDDDDDEYSDDYDEESDDDDDEDEEEADDDEEEDEKVDDLIAAEKSLPRVDVAVFEGRLIDRSGEFDVCSICLEAWANEGDHQICCLPCGHIYGRSCIKKWLQQRRRSYKRCPQCNISCKSKDVTMLYATQLCMAGLDKFLLTEVGFSTLKQKPDASIHPRCKWGEYHDRIMSTKLMSNILLITRKIYEYFASLW